MVFFFILFLLFVIIIFSIKKGKSENKLFKYKNIYRFSKNFKINPTITLFFIKYIIRSFNVDYSNFPKIITFLKKNKSDYEIYSFLREKKRFQEYKISLKVDIIKEILEKHIKNLKNLKLLDIGTESLKFLDKIEEFCFCKTFGINISEGFIHYEKEFSKIKDKRFQLYDGKNIPFKDKEMDIIIITSVLHHIQEKEIEEFIKEICRVSKSYILVKENDLIDQITIDFYDMQHEIFEGVLNEEGESYRNHKINREFIKKIFEKNKFKEIYYLPYNNFSKTFYSLFVFQI